MCKGEYLDDKEGKFSTSYKEIKIVVSKRFTTNYTNNCMYYQNYITIESCKVQFFNIEVKLIKKECI